MSSGGVNSDGVVSEMTLAFFKDSNWFAHVDLSMAE